MLVGIDARTFDIDGSFLFDIDEKESDIQEAPRRVSRTATLDGNAAVTDFGFSHGDRDLTLVFDADKIFMSSQLLTIREIIDKLWLFFRTYSEIALTLPDGVYNASINRYSNKFGRVSLKILIESSL